MSMRWSSHDTRGLFAALAILVAWGGLLATLLRLDLHGAWTAAAPLLVLLQTFLYTGLFITAHDAMHGTITPSHRGLNNAIGTAAVILYALFSYRKLSREHWEHHKHPGDPEADPDYHDGRHPGFFAWYLHFMGHYLGAWQVLGMALVFNLLLHLAGVPLVNLVLFWVLPALLSTVQLFYFGTYLPHREPEGGYSNPHRATSNAFPVLISFLTCYHFGYHLEHHTRPDVPWWKLPEYRRELLRSR